MQINIKNGFSIIEILVILFILAIVISIGGTTLSSYLPRAHLKRASRTIVSLCQLAKVEALKRNSRIACVFLASVQSVSIYTDSGDGNWDTEADNTLLRRFVLSDVENDIDFGHGSATENVAGDSFGSDLPLDGHFEFSGRGSLKNSTENDEDNTLYLENRAGDSFAITVHPSGGVTTSEWTGTTWQ